MERKFLRERFGSGNYVPRTPPHSVKGDLPPFLYNIGGLRGALVAPLQFDTGFCVSVGFQCAFDAPAKFGEHDIDLLGFPVFNVVLDLQHERLYGGEFGCIQI